MSKINKMIIIRITLTAIFIAFAVVTKIFFSIPVAIFGANGMKIGLSGIFTTFPAILFGPIYGGISSAVSDVLGYMIKPDGAYIPWLTLTAFAGGILKGLLWYLIANRKETKFKVIILAFSVIVGAFGIVSHVSLYNDGIIKNYISAQRDLPTKGKMMAVNISPISKITTELAKYNNDTITLKSYVDAEAAEITIPTVADIDGCKSKITKIGAGAFTDCINLKVVNIPDTIKSIDETAFDALAEQVTVAASDEDILTVSSDTYSADGYTLLSSDTYRKYLAGYINFTTVGMECVMLLGIVYFITDTLISILHKKYTDNKNDQKSGNGGNFIKIWISVCLSGIIVTTINTQILKVFLEAWNDRAFLILWIPRVIEEIIVCSVQAYIITILYNVYLTRIEGRIVKLANIGNKK